MAQMIEITDMCHTYIDAYSKEVTALDGINLTIEQGEFIAIIGTNGSGKSTLAKHMNALLLPTAGHCNILGLDTAEDDNVWKIRQSVGMVFQNPDNQIVAAVVEEDVAFGPENLGVPPRDIAKRVEQALKLVGMEEYRYHAPHLLSGGQKQRVAIAGVLAMKPKCMILDEPTAMLDPQGRNEVMATILRLNKEEGITIVHITHFMEEAVQADKVVVMDQGKIVLAGTPREVFTQTDLLKQIGLDVPLAAEVADRLRQQGVSLAKEIITNEELAVALWQLD